MCEPSLGRNPPSPQLVTPRAGVYQERLQQLRQVLLNRPEPCIAVVAHWGVVSWGGCRGGGVNNKPRAGWGHAHDERDHDMIPAENEARKGSR